MKKVFVKVMAISAGLMLCQSAIALDCKITDNTKKMVSEYYDGTFSGNAVQSFVESLECRYQVGTESEAYGALLPKFFEIVAAEAKKPYWFWKTNYKKSDWWKALNAKYGSANEFMAYIYNINDDKAKKLSGVTAMPEKGYIVYRLDGNEFKKESTSLLSKHWGKIALAGVLAAGSALAWRYRGEITPVAEGAWSGLRNAAEDFRGGVSDAYGYARRSIFGLNPEERVHKQKTKASLREAKRQLGNARMQYEVNQYMDRK